MEEQRQRQEEEARKTVTGTEETAIPKPQVADNEEDMLQQALAMSRTSPDGEINLCYQRKQQNCFSINIAIYITCIVCIIC